MDLQALANQGIELVSLYGLRVVAALVIVVVGRWVARLLGSLTEGALTKRDIDATVRQFIGKLVFALVMVFAVIAALSNVGIQTASIIAALGAAGLAIGLALQGSLSNFAAGVLIVVLRPCRVGDYVEAGGAAGTVNNISLFFTTLLTPDNKQIIVPNSAIIGAPITNYSAMPQRRVDIKVGIGYSADIQQAKAELKQLLESDQRVLQTPPYVIAVVELADSSVNLAVRAWVNSPDYWDVYFHLMESIKLRFDEAGIEIPFPQRTVHLQHVPEPAAR